MKKPSKKIKELAAPACEAIYAAIEKLPLNQQVAVLNYILDDIIAVIDGLRHEIPET